MENVRLLKTAKLLFLAFLATLVFGTAIAITVVNIGTVEFPYEIITKASMSPTTVTINLGSIAPGATNNVASTDSGSDLTISAITDIGVTLSGHTAFTAFSVTIELKQGGVLKYSATVHQAATTYTISSVAVGTYDIFVGYSYTAGASAGSGTVSVTLAYP